MGIFSKKKRVEEKKTGKVSVASATIEHLAWRTLIKPYISEKATDLAKENKYLFLVTDESNKTEIKKAIKELYGVEVLSVKIVNIPKRKKRLGKYKGWRKGFKKAIIEVKEGQKIDATPK